MSDFKPGDLVETQINGNWEKAYLVSVPKQPDYQAAGLVLPRNIFSRYYIDIRAIPETFEIGDEVSITGGYSGTVKAIEGEYYMVQYTQSSRQKPSWHPRTADQLSRPK